MTAIARIFSDRPSSVYRVDSDVDAAALMHEAHVAGLTFFLVNCEAADTKESLLRAIAESLSFPGYFGNNWDALEECLTDLSWLPAKGYVVLLDRLEHTGPQVLAGALAIFEDAARYWARKKTPFYVLLSGSEQLTSHEREQ
jgi:RNAse (barnase) inhibitor barstar